MRVTKLILNLRRLLTVAIFFMLASFGTAMAVTEGEVLRPAPLAEVMTSSGGGGRLGGLGDILGRVGESALRGDRNIDEVRVVGARSDGVQLRIQARDFEGEMLSARAVDANGDTLRTISGSKARISGGAAVITLKFAGGAPVNSAFLLIDVTKAPFAFRMAHNWNGSGAPAGPTADAGGAGAGTPSAGAAAQLTPASDGRTQNAVRRATTGGASASYASLSNVRLTNRKGYIDATVNTDGKPTYATCKAACDSTEECQAFVVKNPPNSSGLYCGLVLNDLGRRYDKYWVSNSSGYTTYRRNEARTPTMIGLRYFSAPLGSNYSYTNRKLIKPTYGVNTGADGFIQCAKDCLDDARCTTFMFNYGRCSVYRYSSNAADRFSFGDFAFAAGASCTDTPTLGRVDEVIDPSVGLGMFKSAGPRQRSLDSYWGGYGEEYLSRMRPLSANVHPQCGTGALSAPPYTGDRPSLNENIPAGQPAAVAVNVESVVAGTGPDDLYSPFAKEIWRDRREPGVYYYLPRAYYFDWDAARGRLGGSQFYNPADEAADDGAGAVRFQLRLSAEFDEEDVEAFRQLAHAAVTAQELPPIEDFRPLPLSGAPAVNLSADLAGVLGSDAGAVTATQPVEGPSAPVTLSFNTTDSRAESMIAAMAGDASQSFGGTLTMRSPKLGGGGQTVSVYLDARRADTYGGEKVAGKVWTNRSPFPATPRQLRALMVYPNRAEILTWNIAETTVAPGDSLRFEASPSGFPEPLWSEAVRVWVDADLDTSCTECMARIFGLGGLSSAVRNVVAFRLSPGLVRGTDVDEVEVYFRSRYLTPEGDRVRSGTPLLLTEADGEQSAETGVLYLRDGLDFGGDEAIYSYQATLRYRDEDGVDRVRCTDWKNAQSQSHVFEFREFVKEGEACGV